MCKYMFNKYANIHYINALFDLLIADSNCQNRR